MSDGWPAYPPPPSLLCSNRCKSSPKISPFLRSLGSRAGFGLRSSTPMPRMRTAPTFPSIRWVLGAMAGYP
eukprot:scaffold315093_cov32-Tisochrysis_lutea.AAC.5